MITRETAAAQAIGRPPRIKLIGVRGTPEQHKRLKMASVETGLPYADLIDMLLDVWESQKRRRAAQAATSSPFHALVTPAPPLTGYPSGGVGLAGGQR